MKLKGKHVLVTGATGLVGGHVVEALINRGARVYCATRNINPDSYFVKQGLHNKAIVKHCDLRYKPAVTKLIADNNIELIFHLAGQLLPHNLYETYTGNIVSMVNILSVSQELNTVKGIFLVSTSRSYVSGLSASDFKKLSFNPYDLSKTAAELIAQSYIHRHGLPVVISRYGNIFGPGDMLPRIVPEILHHIRSGKVLYIKGSGREKRNYIYVKDVAASFILQAEKLEKITGRTLNFPGPWKLSPVSLIRKVSRVLDRSCDYKILNINKNEVSHSRTFNQSSSFRFKPKYSFEQAIKQTFEYYQKRVRTRA